MHRFLWVDAGFHAQVAWNWDNFSSVAVLFFYSFDYEVFPNYSPGASLPFADFL